MLLNMSIGNGDMSIPTVYHYLPHLIGKPSSLKPVVKLSKGRAGGKYANIWAFCLYFFFMVPSKSFCSVVCCSFLYINSNVQKS